MEAVRIGYVRCSTDRQDLTAQRSELVALGVDPKRIYSRSAFVRDSLIRGRLGGMPGQAFTSLAGGGPGWVAETFQYQRYPNTAAGATARPRAVVALLC